MSRTIPGAARKGTGYALSMDALSPLVSPHLVLLAALIAGLAGIVKGITGFAMPMVMISGLSTVLPPDLALAFLILPTLVTNTWQALRQGTAAALGSIRRFRVFLLVGLAMLLVSAQLVRVLPERLLFGMIGGPVSLFALVQLGGWVPRLSGGSRLIEGAIGGFAGFIGGISGVWGPPTVAYLTAIDTPKADQMRVQGVIYGLGAVALFGAHVQSGVMRAETAPYSALMIVPALIGMTLGLRIQDRFDQKTFRRVTLIVLLVAGLNLVRKALT